MSGAALADPSDWLRAHADALREAAARGPVLDLAAGRGRHALAAAELGAWVVALDRSRAALGELAAHAAARGRAREVACVQADLECGHGIPLRAGAFAAVLVFRYLHRPLAPAIEALLAPGGLLLYETFTIHQRKLGYGPGNPAFLLEPGELERLFPGLRVEASQEGPTGGSRPLELASLRARKPAAEGG